MYDLIYYLLIALAINLIMFIPAYIFKTDKLTDLSYSLTFIILILFALFQNNIKVATIIIASMVVIWGLRLGIFLFVRIRKMEKDKRFDGIRESFPRFLKFWFLQGLAVWIILIPAIFFITSSPKIIFTSGIAIWILGLTIETIADIQKYRFKQNNKNKNNFISTGLWKHSRHPNYFGEILCWVGIYIAVFPALTWWQNLIGILSPLFITYIITSVTGIPLLERQADKEFGKRKDYQEYKRKTPLLFLWKPKK